MKSIKRRDFLHVSGLTAALAALSACDPLEMIPTSTPYTPPMEKAPVPQASHLLRRTTFGPTAAELAQAHGMGVEAWLEGQLQPEELSVEHVEERLQELETYRLSPVELLELESNGRVAQDLAAATLIRQIFSPRQLYETMVDFWSNHFNIFAYAPPQLFLKAKDDDEVIRPNALGSFPEMLMASASSPAMLVYLDNAQSQTPQPNENYARELLELHTMGVDGGYTHEDVVTVARAFTGWTVNGLRRARGEPGEFRYNPNWHDPGDKSLFGETLPGGEGDAERVLQLLAEHPSTARHIATKLCARFVSDYPPESIIGAVAETYLQTDGSIAAMLRTLFHSEEFASSAGLKLKRPMDFALSAVRVLGADGRLDRPLRLYLELLGQFPFGWPAPDGYPEAAAAWSNTNQSLYRWNMAVVLASGAVREITTEIPALFEDLPETELVDQLALHILGVPLPSQAKSVIEEFIHGLDGFEIVPVPSLVSGMLLASPYFQIR